MFTHLSVPFVNCNPETNPTLVLQVCQKHRSQAESSSPKCHPKHKWLQGFACPHQLILPLFFFSFHFTFHASYRQPALKAL